MVIRFWGRTTRREVLRVVVSLGLLLPSAVACGQGSPATPADPAAAQSTAPDASAGTSPPSTPAAAPFDPEEWQRLVQRKAETVARLKEVQQVLPNLEPGQRQQVLRDAQALQMSFSKEVVPRMAELAPTAYARNPDDLDAAEFMLQLEFNKNRYDHVAEIADGVLSKDDKHALALNYGGVAAFGLHNFERSISLLEQAQAANVLNGQMGLPMLENARNYVKYWQQEQEIRAREAAAAPAEQLPRVLMKTTKGDILIELFENEAPNTVANFVKLVESGFYDGTEFHRVLPTFMAQGGRANSPEKAVNYTIPCECYAPSARRHFAGSLSMAHAGKDTGSTQFFITHLPTPHLDREIQPSSVHTVFGRVVEGIETVWALRVADTIESATVVRKRNHEYVPQVIEP
jgi:cyclophilin family peptidyl-prolyl cis-trans isomerase